MKIIILIALFGIVLIGLRMYLEHRSDSRSDND